MPALEGSTTSEPSAKPNHATSSTALPLVAASVSAALFLGMDVIIKLLSARFDTLQLTALRFASGCLFAVPLWWWFRTPLPARSRWPMHALRTTLLLLAMLTWFYCLSALPLVQAVAVGYLAPILISLLAMLVLRERPSAWIWAALALGLSGVAVSLWPELRDSAAPGSAERVKGLLGAAASALFYAGSVIVARHQAQHDALWTILLVQNLLPAALVAAALCLPGAANWPAISGRDAALVLLMGMLVTGGLVTITWAFTHIEASLAAPMEYTGLVWAVALGYLFFAEMPSANSLASAGLIICGCLLLLRRR